MTPQTKKRVLNVGAIVSATLTIGGMAVKSSAQALDGRYVHTDTFAVFQAGEAQWRLRDSLTLAAEMRDMRRMLSGLDSSDRCRRGQREFCR